MAPPKEETTAEETNETNSTMQIFSWEDCRRIIGRRSLPLTTLSPSSLNSRHPSETRALDELKRRPANRIRYKAWAREIRSDYGTVPNYVSIERLGWGPLAGCTAPASSTAPSSGLAPREETLLADPSDYKLLWNDWPYGSIAPGIVHLVLWSKVPFEADRVTGILDSPSQAIVKDFIEREIVQRLVRTEGVSADDARSRILWFKNGESLQSIRALEHIHILLKDAPQTVLVELTGDEEPSGPKALLE
jgi:hypothetical protein